MSFVSSLRIAISPPHTAGLPFISAGVLLAAIGLVTQVWLVWLGLGFALFCAFFFRDPRRVPPDRPGLIVAPADGHVVFVSLAAPPAELALGETPRWRVAIFLSVLDVHVNRIPAAGIVRRIAYRHGLFFNASLDKASEDNERNALAISLPNGGDLAVVQIAGLIARRIVCTVHEGEVVATGARFGLIRFGSRTDLYLPLDVTPLVSVGQTMIGGETVVAEL